MNNKRARIGITMGDPSGIGPEILVKALSNRSSFRNAHLIVFGDLPYLDQAQSLLGTNLLFSPWDPEDQKQEEGPSIPYCGRSTASEISMGTVQAICGESSLRFISQAVESCRSGRIDALVTGPIHKGALRLAGISFIGHTEILAYLTGSSNPMTMFQVDALKVFFLTRHMSLKQACAWITKERVLEGIIQTRAGLERLGHRFPKIAVAALNPHAGENGLFGDEEKRFIEPAVMDAQNQGMDVHGPIPADSVFHQAAEGRYDGVLSLYHDQGHIATKMMDFDKTVSVTLGLPFIRTSVDHGTGMDIAGQGIASPISMEEAIRVAWEYAQLRGFPSANQRAERELNHQNRYKSDCS